MPTIYSTPGVYVEEVATLPPSVAPVATAVPAFIGYTEKAGKNGEYLNQPVRITSMLEYTTLFGGAQPTEFEVTVNDAEQITDIRRKSSDLSSPPSYLMYYALRLFFQNEGGSCYVVSIGDYSGTINKDDFQKAGEIKGLDTLIQEDEPTLILMPDAVNLSENNDYYELCKSALAQCNKLKDRFAILDVLASDRTTNAIGSGFRKGIGTESLKYGAAYYPYLQTSLTYEYTDDSVSVPNVSLPKATQGNPIKQYKTGEDGLVITYNGSNDSPTVKITKTNRQSIAIELDDGGLVIRLPGSEEATVADILAEANTSGTNTGNYNLIAANASATATIVSALEQTNLSVPSSSANTTGSKLSDLKVEKTVLYNEITTAINSLRVVMPPSSAVAGVYAKVDRERGVWKAPANVSLAGVIGPMVKITNDQQNKLNIDATSGKSINAIRSFTGKGTLIWGARTLAGNDNEWRYISVRRLFNLIEESIQKATAFAVFESNNAVTWLKIRTIIDTYLEGLWRQGALAGATQQQAYFVSVGLGQTMTEQDILEGRMIIDIGVAAVRPAEFITLRFSHKLQQA